MRALGQNPTSAEVAAWVEEYDNGHGRITFPDFLTLMRTHRKSAAEMEQVSIDMWVVVENRLHMHALITFADDSAGIQRWERS